VQAGDDAGDTMVPNSGKLYIVVGERKIIMLLILQWFLDFGLSNTAIRLVHITVV